MKNQQVRTAKLSIHQMHEVHILPSSRPIHLDEKLASLRREAFSSSLSWIEEEGTAKYVGGEHNRLVSLLLLFTRGSCMLNTCFFLS